MGGPYRGRSREDIADCKIEGPKKYKVLEVLKFEDKKTITRRKYPILLHLNRGIVLNGWKYSQE